jgi:hypothetical protein
MIRLSIIVLLISAFSASSLPIQMIGKGRPRGVVSAVCATSDTTLPHDQLLEGWQNSGPENTWTSWVGTDVASFDQNFDTSALTTGKPVGACDRGLQVTVTGTAGEETIYWNRGSAVTVSLQAVDVYFYINVTTSPDAGENISICNLNSTATGSGSVMAYINVRNNAGSIEIQAEASTSSAFTALSSGWNKCKVHLDTTAASSYFQLNDGTQNTFTRLGTTFQYVHIGAEQHALNENITYVVDLITVDFP